MDMSEETKEDKEVEKMDIPEETEEVIDENTVHREEAVVVQGV